MNYELPNPVSSHYLQAFHFLEPVGFHVVAEEEAVGGEGEGIAQRHGLIDATLVVGETSEVAAEICADAAG